jgi:hypothetical protein
LCRRNRWSAWRCRSLLAVAHVPADPDETREVTRLVDQLAVGELVRDPVAGLRLESGLDGRRAALPENPVERLSHRGPIVRMDVLEGPLADQFLRIVVRPSLRRGAESL